MRRPEEAWRGAMHPTIPCRNLALSERANFSNHLEYYFFGA